VFFSPSSLAAEADDRAVALVGEDHPHRAVVAEALDDDPAVAGADHIGAADAHVAGLLDGDIGPADIAVPAKAVPAAASVVIASTAAVVVSSTAAVVIADDKVAAGAADGKFETDAAGIGGRGGGGDAGGGDDEGGECGAKEAVHDGFSWGGDMAPVVVSVSTGCSVRLI
jgi:hypothetical protein